MADFGVSLATNLVKPVAAVLRPPGETVNTITWGVQSSKLQGWNLQRKVDSGAWSDMSAPAAIDRSAVDSGSSTPGTYYYRIRSFRGNRYSQFSDEVSIVVPSGPPAGGTITESDPIYLGAYDLPIALKFQPGVGFIDPTSNQTPIGFRNGKMLHVMPDQPDTNNWSAFAPNGAEVFQVNIPALLTSPPYNVATLDRYFGNIYGDKKLLPFIATYRWTYCLYPDPDNWDEVYFNFGGYYSANDSTSPTLGRSVLNDTTVTGTVDAQWGFSGVNNRMTRSGILRMPSDFVAANCPGRPFLVGSGGGYFANLAGSSFGPCGFAIPRPVLATHPDESDLPNTHMWSYPWHTSIHAPPLRQRRTADYEGGLWGTLGGAFGGSATASTLTMPDNIYGQSNNSNYAGIVWSIVSGPNQQTVTVGSQISGRTYNITWTNGTPQAGSQFEARWVPASVFNDEWPPQGTIGYYTAGDRVSGGMAWVRGSPRGLMVFVTRPTGLQFYGHGQPFYQGGKHSVEIYDQNDIAAAMAGDIEGWEIEPVARWDIQIPGITYPLPQPGSGGYSNLIGGVAYDDANRKVYIGVNNQRVTGFGATIPRIHCWQIPGSN